MSFTLQDTLNGIICFCSIFALWDVWQRDGKGNFLRSKMFRIIISACAFINFIGLMVHYS